MTTRSSIPRLPSGSGARAACAALLLLCAPLSLFAQSARLTWNRTDPAANQTITLSARTIASWTEQNYQVFLLSGDAYIEQGVLQGRMENAVVWVNLESQRKTGKYQVEVYGENLTQLLDGSNSVIGTQATPRALFTLITSAQVKGHVYVGTIVSQSQTQNPLYQRTVAERARPATGGVVSAGGAVAPGQVQQTAAQVPAPTPPAGQVQGTPVQQFQPLQQPPTPPDTSPKVPPPSVPANPSQPSQQPQVGPQPKVVPLEDMGPAPRRSLVIVPRSSLIELKARDFPQPNGETIVVVTGGVILQAGDGRTFVDIEADRLVFWTRGNFQDTLNGLRQTGGNQNNQPPEEFYLSGNVELRNQSPKEARLIRADEVYYNTARNVSIALNAKMEIREVGVADPVHINSPEIDQLNAELYKLKETDLNASKLPSDPGIKVTFTTSQVETVTVPRTASSASRSPTPRPASKNRKCSGFSRAATCSCTSAAYRSSICRTSPPTSTIRSAHSTTSRSTTTRFSASSCSPPGTCTSCSGCSACRAHAGGSTPT